MKEVVHLERMMFPYGAQDEYDLDLLVKTAKQLAAFHAAEIKLCPEEPHFSSVDSFDLDNCTVTLKEGFAPVFFVYEFAMIFAFQPVSPDSVMPLQAWFLEKDFAAVEEERNDL